MERGTWSTYTRARCSPCPSIPVGWRWPACQRPFWRMSAAAEEPAGVLYSAGRPLGRELFVYLAGEGTGFADLLGWTAEAIPATTGVAWRLQHSALFRPTASGWRSPWLPAREWNIWVKDLDRDHSLSSQLPRRHESLPGVDSRWEEHRLSIHGLVRARLVLDPFGRLGRGTASDRWQAQRIPIFIFAGRNAPAFNRDGNGGSVDIFTAAIESDPGRGTPGVHLGKPSCSGDAVRRRAPRRFRPTGAGWRTIRMTRGPAKCMCGRFQGLAANGRFRRRRAQAPSGPETGVKLIFETLDGRVMAAS